MNFSAIFRLCIQIYVVVLKTFEPLISVAKSIYNSGEFVREASEVVLAQACPVVENIVVKDGSTE